MKLATVFAPVALALAAAAASFALFGATAAEASEPMSALSCQVETDNVNDYLVNVGGIANQSTGLFGGRPRNLHCQVPSSIRTNFTGNLFVDGFDGTTSRTAR